MNKILLTVYTLLFTVSLCIAQSSKIKIGVRAGMNMGRWRLNSPDASDMGPFKLPEGASIQFSKFSQLTRALKGLTCSIPVEIQLQSFLFLQPELNFTQKGARFISSYTVPPFYTSTPVLDIRTGYRAERISSYVYNYLEVPVIAKVRFRHNRYILDMAAGPYLGLALNGKLRIKDDITFYDGSKTTDKWSALALRALNSK